MRYFKPIRFSIKLVFFISIFSVKIQAQQVITLEQALHSALKNNLLIKQAQLSVALSEENLSQTKHAQLPNLSAGINPSLNFGRGLDQNSFQITNQTSLFLNGSVSAGIDLFQGFAKINQIKQNKLLLDADKKNIEKVKNDLILQVVTAYLQVLYNVDLVEATKAQLNITQQSLKKEQELQRVGNKTLADLSQAKALAATAALNLTNAQNQLDISYLTLRQLMEMPSTAIFKVQAPLISKFANSVSVPDANQIYQNALNTYPDIILSGLRAKATKQAIEVAKGAYFPRLSLGLGMYSSYSYAYSAWLVQKSFSEQVNERFGQTLSLNFSVPLFNGFSAKHNIRKSKINYQNAENQVQIAKNNLSKIIFQAVADLKAAQSRYQSALNVFEAQKDAFNALEQRYFVGLANTLDYNTARTNRNKAEVDFIQSKYDLLFRSKVIDYYLGKEIGF